MNTTISNWPDAAIGAFVNVGDKDRILFVRTMERHEQFVEGVALDTLPYQLFAHRWQWIERPAAEWDGQGLPPVGVECEAVHDDAWRRVKVIACDEGRTVFRWAEGSDKGVYAAYTLPICFRPLRTAEQLAAEQRQAAIDAMCREIEQAVGYWNHSIDASVAMRAVVEALHDAGYRK